MGDLDVVSLHYYANQRGWDPNLVQEMLRNPRIGERMRNRILAETSPAKQAAIGLSQVSPQQQGLRSSLEGQGEPPPPEAQETAQMDIVRAAFEGADWRRVGQLVGLTAVLAAHGPLLTADMQARLVSTFPPAAVEFAIRKRALGRNLVHRRYADLSDASLVEGVGGALVTLWASQTPPALRDKVVSQLSTRMGVITAVETGNSVEQLISAALVHSATMM